MAFVRGANVVTEGLVLALDAANPKSYVSGSLDWRDLSGTNVTGSLVNGPTFNSGNGGSIQFDGVDDSVNSNQFSFINGTSSKSLEVWFNPTMSDSSTVVQLGTQGSTGRDFTIACTAENDTGVNTNIPAVYKALGGLYAAFWARDIYIPLGYTTNIKNKWIHAVLTIDTSSQACLYYNGTLPLALSMIDLNWSQTLQQQPFTFTSINTLANNPSYIGRAATNTPWGVGQLYFSGFISMVRMYNKALSAQEVLQNYNATKARFGIE